MAGLNASTYSPRYQRKLQASVSRHRSTLITCSASPEPAAASRRQALLAAGAAAGVLGQSSQAGAAPRSELLLPRVQPGTSKLGFEKRVQEFTLPNGLHFVVLERKRAPVVSCYTIANVGAWEEEEGKTGIAHLLEHMAFKGTPSIGSVDYRREAPMLDALDEVFYELREARSAAAAAGGSAAAGQRVASLQAKLRQLQGQADQLVVPNAFGSLLSKEGGIGLNATTSHDFTRYFVSLPSNKLELWFAAEAERFQAPVFRQLYSEKEVVAEERRLRVDDAPGGAWQEAFALAALGNNYRRPVIGYREDVANLGRRELQDFFARYYGPANLTISIAGDVTAQQVYLLALKYFRNWNPSGYVKLAKRVRPKETSREPLPLPGSASAAAAAAAGGSASSATSGSSSSGSSSSSSSGSSSARPASGASSMSYVAPAASGPGLMLGYYRPPLSTRDGVVLQILADVLYGGRSSRLQRQLVQRGRALSASMVASYPGAKHAGLSLVLAEPAKGVALEKLDRELRDVLAQVADGGVTAVELQRVKKDTTGTLFDIIASNSSAASALASYQATTGSWRGLLEEVAFVESLTPQVVQAEAQRLFADANCFTGYILPTAAKAAAAAARA